MNRIPLDSLRRRCRNAWSGKFIFRSSCDPSFACATNAMAKAPQFSLTNEAISSPSASVCSNSKRYIQINTSTLQSSHCLFDRRSR